MQFSLFVYVCLSFLFCSSFGGHSCKEINGDISSQAISFNFFTFMLQFGGQCVHTLALSGCSSDRVNIWAMTDHIIWVLEGSSARDVSWQCLMQLAASTRVPFRWQALPIALGAHCRLLLSPVLSFSGSTTTRTCPTERCLLVYSSLRSFWDYNNAAMRCKHK